MTELRRKSDIVENKPDLETSVTPPPFSEDAQDVIAHDPIQKRSEIYRDQHIKRINAQIEMSHENARLRIENGNLKEHLKVLYNEAYSDDLTGLPNQRFLRKSFAEAVAKGDKLVLLFLDLNKFKEINDTYGHDVGDEALKLASKVLVSLTRSTDVIAHISEEKQDPETHLPVRFAGDEFIILFTGTTLEDLQKKLADVKSAFSELALKVGDKEIPVRASIGAYEYQKGDTLEHCKKQADIAMYADKKSSRQDSSTLPFGRFAGYILPPSTGYVPTTTGYSFLSSGFPKPEPR